MGQTYHYFVSLVLAPTRHNQDQGLTSNSGQYELNGTTDAHDPRQPSTTSYALLPGQLVNTIALPIEHSLRLRSCSMNNLRHSDYKTVNPKDKYNSPMPPRPPTAGPAPGPTEVRVGTAPTIQLIRKRSARSLSPNPKWTASARKIFGTIRPSSREGNGSARTLADWDADVTTLKPKASTSRSNSAAPSSTARSRDISPDSLRRFLLGNDVPAAEVATTSSALQRRPTVCKHDDMAEDNDDDDKIGRAHV